MALDEKVLVEHHSITRLSVQSNTQISSRATAVISKLSNQQESETTTKPALVVLSAQSRWASKLISIVEIAKRDLESKGVKVFQYNALSSELIEFDRKPKTKTSEPERAAVEEAASDDDAFQTMGAHEEGGKKKRAVPIMTVYLATGPVKALKSEFG